MPAVHIAPWLFVLLQFGRAVTWSISLSLRLAQLPNTLTHSQTGLIPLLTSSGDGQGGSSFATSQSDDELSTNYGGLDLEALSRLDGRRWSSSCRSQEGLELVAVNRDGEEESMTESIRTLSQKYRPMFFEELIGQNIVVQSLMNAILRGRVASLYLFQGPRGTGKTSTARVLAAALNCLASNKTKPCGSYTLGFFVVAAAAAAAVVVDVVVVVIAAAGGVAVAASVVVYQLILFVT
ncbi:hypothetical protein RJ639_026579 [Escallonia herrerae]|uniref:Uncharacterized protein n=1 Tax=Escallonia herrerae TaxID=1293975 RepID=A0AA88UVB1_9ASTE|nr:hypothetical protein RJ639_026579 [Escallonia herrerae]